MTCIVFSAALIILAIIGLYLLCKGIKGLIYVFKSLKKLEKHGRYLD
jgi:uncharacterized membrane protein HdeD (DUF308 family)